MTTPTITNESTLTKKQVKHYGPKLITYGGIAASITVEVRYDDECGNGHNSFAITATINESGKPRSRAFMAGGCLHGEVAEHFPELAPFIKWHLSSSDGPMHYIANASFHASDRDCWGRAKGEPSRYEYGVRFDKVPVTHRLKESFFKFIHERHDADGLGQFQVVAFAHDRDPKTFGTHYTFAGYGEKWHECPFHDKEEAEQFAAALNSCKVDFVREATEWSEGKPRDLAAARHCAVWPEATDEELTAPDLKDKLAARLPALLADFRKDIESLGFVW